VNEPRLDRPGKILAFAAVVEAATGLALLVDPAIVARLLLGVALPGLAEVLGRCFGIALLALALACWPRPAVTGSAFRAMLAYNTLIALYLAYLGTSGGMRGSLLWPAVALHAAVAAALVWSHRGAPSRTSSS
jgi:hypothetical protein